MARFLFIARGRPSPTSRCKIFKRELYPVASIQRFYASFTLLTKHDILEYYQQKGSSKIINSQYVIMVMVPVLIPF